MDYWFVFDHVYFWLNPNRCDSVEEIQYDVTRIQQKSKLCKEKKIWNPFMVFFTGDFVKVFSIFLA